MTKRKAKAAKAEPVVAKSFDDYAGKTVDFYGVCGNQFKVALDGEAPVVFDVREDESDGYRSYLDSINVTDSAEGPFFDQPIAKVTVSASDSPDMDVWELVDVERCHVWLTFGTDNSCDYYPTFVFRYEAMAPDGVAKPFVCENCTTDWHDGCHDRKCTCGFCTGDEPRGPVVQSQGLDLNEYALKYILPGAAEMCEEGRLREVALERDNIPTHRAVYWMVEVSHGVWETTSQLPFGMPPLVVRGKSEYANWAYVQHLEKYRIARGEKSRKIARESTFMVAGRGVQT